MCRLTFVGVSRCRRLNVYKSVLDGVSRGWRTRCSRYWVEGQVVCILNRVPVSVLLMLNSSGRTGGMFNQMNKVSNLHVQAHLSLVTG